MAKLTLTDISDFRNQTTTANTINSNNSAIEAALENTLSRDGTTPNVMSADLDMNSNDLLNVDNITATTSNITTSTVNDIYVNGQIHYGPGAPQAVAGPGVPTGGTTGQTLKKNSNTSYDLTWTSDIFLTGTSVRFLYPITPTTNDGAALGSTSNQWSDLFLASGGVINWANGNVTLTHSSGTLTTTGDLAISKSGPALTLNKPASGTSSQIVGTNNGVTRFSIELGDAGAESGSNTGSDFALSAFNDAGTWIDTPISVARAAGGGISLNRQVNVSGSVIVGATSGGTYNGNTVYQTSDQYPTVSFRGGTTVKAQFITDVSTQSLYFDVPGAVYFRDTINGGGLIWLSLTSAAATFAKKVVSTNPTGGVGYTTGAGGTVAQATSKSTGVTLNKVTGEITMNGAALAAGTIVSFTLTNSAITATDVMIINHVSTGTLGAYTFNASCGSGSATIYVRNETAGSLSEAIVLRYVLIKGATN